MAFGNNLGCGNTKPLPSASMTSAAPMRCTTGSIFLDVAAITASRRIVGTFGQVGARRALIGVNSQPASPAGNGRRRVAPQRNNFQESVTRIA